MILKRRPLLVGAGLTAAAVLAFGTPAAAHPGHPDHSGDGAVTAEDGARDTAQHGQNSGHLPATSENVRLLSKLKLSDVEPEKIADVAVFGDHAYLNAWGGAGATPEERCDKTGVYVVDIGDPREPQEVSFIPAPAGSYPGEGAQVIRIDTPAYRGDVLLTNNETCAPDAGVGGFNMYHVTQPARPRVLSEGVRDTSRGDTENPRGNLTHSVFAWDAGDKAYAVTTDNEEGKDVDIFDITNPRRPALIAEYDIDETFPQILQAAPENLTEVFLHDMVVRQIDGRQVMLLSYWDGGYVAVDVTDPTAMSYLGDTDFTDPDPELVRQTGRVERPEGNAHQAEFTRDNRFVIGADEDFAPFGLSASTDEGEEFFVAQGSGTPPLSSGQELTGTTVYVGRACTADTAVPAATAEGQIAVAVRGVCTFTEKVANITGKGYAGVVIVNREGACGAFGMNVEGELPAFSVARDVGLGFFDLAYDEEACLAGVAEELPGVALGQTGDAITLRAFFDGWGYVHLYDYSEGKMTELDTYAIPEAMDESKATGFGDLSVHEVATSQRNSQLAYLSYYSGGFRVVKVVEGFEGARLQEVGRFIDEGGSNFWGVETFRGPRGREYVAASDRDYGLYIFEYTGP